MSGYYNVLSLFTLQSQNDAPMSAELRQVAQGCAHRVMSYGGYDVNGFRFHTTRHEQSRPNWKSTNTGVFTPGQDGMDYYGRIEDIYELTFQGCRDITAVIFKCHWFDPQVTRLTPNLGLVEIRQDTVLPGDDVYIVAQQAKQVYYTSYPCKTDARLVGWDVVHKVSPRGGVPVPNNEDYNLNTDTYEGEFYQEEGLQGTFVIDLSEPMDVPIVVEDEDDVEVDDARDLELLEKLSLDIDNDDNGAAPVSDEYLHMDGTDDEMEDAPDDGDEYDDYF